MKKTMAELENELQYWDDVMKGYDSHSKEHHNARQRKYKVKKRIQKLRESIDSDALKEAMALGHVLQRIHKHSSLNDLIATYAYWVSERKKKQVRVDGRYNPEYLRINASIQKLRKKIEQELCKRLNDLDGRIATLLVQF